MLPPGHLAAGFLLTVTTLKIVNPDLEPAQLRGLIVIGTFFAFAPDLDMFYSFFRAKSFVSDTENSNHRRFLTHKPVLWLTLSLLIFLISSEEYFKIFALLLWLGSWSHFFLDSLNVGVQWLWPLNSKYYAFVPKEKNRVINKEKNFFGYWFRFLRDYQKKLPVTFYAEALVLFSFFIYLYFSKS